MNAFLDALRFLTIFPTGRSINAAARRLNLRPEYFPVVGLLIGIVLAGADAVFSLLLPPAVAGACTIIALIVMTGGLHLDGLADTADGFFSSRPREEILRIMKDSRTGAMGVAAVAGIIVLKVAAASSLAPDTRIPALLLTPVAGRCAMAALLTFMPAARPDGLAAELVRPQQGRRHPIWPFASLLFIGWLAWRTNGIVQVVVSLSAAAPLALLMRRKIGGVTGDTLGAACEVVETVSLLTAAAIGFAMKS